MTYTDLICFGIQHLLHDLWLDERKAHLVTSTEHQTIRLNLTIVSKRHGAALYSLKDKTYRIKEGSSCNQYSTPGSLPQPDYHQ